MEQLMIQTVTLDGDALENSVLTGLGDLVVICGAFG